MLHLNTLQPLFRNKKCIYKSYLINIFIHSDWLKRYQLWQSFNERLRDLKMTTNHLLKLQNEDNQIELSNIEVMRLLSFLSGFF